MMSAPTSTPSAVTGLLLAGGMGRRMGGADKGLVVLDGRPMAAWVLDRLRPQVGTLLINANRNPEMWNSFGYPLVADRITGYAGPLAGIHAGLAICATPLLVTAPCDSPFMPTDLVARLATALEQEEADLAVVRSNGRLQPVFALMRRSVLDSLEGYLDEGGRKIDTWFAMLRMAVVDFDDDTAFANINTPDELAAARTG
jgi:molybdopterin-guanine dinucleotide biosynthesis protein A